MKCRTTPRYLEVSTVQIFEIGGTTGQSRLISRFNVRHFAITRFRIIAKFLLEAYTRLRNSANSPILLRNALPSFRTAHKSLSRLALLCVIFVLTGQTMNALATEYPASLGQTAHFGVGFDRQSMTEAGSCVTDEEPPAPIAQAGGQELQMQVLEIEDYQALDNAMGISSGLAVKHFDVGISANFGHSESIGIHKYSKFKLLRVLVTNSATAYKSPRFRPEIVALLTQRSADVSKRFRERCGTEYVHGYITGGRYFVLIEIKSQSTVQAERNEGGLAVQSPNLSVNVEGFKELMESTANRQYALTVLRVGGAGKTLGTDLKGLLKGAEEFANEVKSDPVRISFITKPYHLLEFPSDGYMWRYRYDQHNFERLAQAINEHKLLASNIAYVLRNTEEFETHDRDALLLEQTIVQRNLERLRKAARDCRNIASGCEVPDNLQAPETLLPDPLSHTVPELCEIGEYRPNRDRGCGRLCTANFLDSATINEVCEELGKGAVVTHDGAWSSGTWTPLSLALHLGREERIVSLLLQFGANTEERGGPLGKLPLHHLACSAGTLASLRNFALLEKHGVNVNSRVPEGDGTALHEASRCNRPGSIDQLLQMGADVDRRDVDGNTPLHIAASLGNRHAAVALIRHDAETNVANARGEAPLHLAAKPKEGGSKGVIEVLLTKGAVIDARDNHGNTALHNAAAVDGALALLLLERGASATMVNEAGDTPLHVAMRSEGSVRGWEEMIEALLERGAEPNQHNSRGANAWSELGLLDATTGLSRVVALIGKVGVPADEQDAVRVLRILTKDLSSAAVRLSGIAADYRSEGERVVVRVADAQKVDEMVRRARSKFNGTEAQWELAKGRIRAEAEQVYIAEQEIERQKLRQKVSNSGALAMQLRQIAYLLSSIWSGR